MAPLENKLNAEQLADLALGLKKSDSRKKKAAAAGAGVHQTSEKTEPYSRSNN